MCLLPRCGCAESILLIPSLSGGKEARSATRLTGTATTTVSFADFGMTAPKVPVVLSVVDEILLELNLVATLAA